MIFKRFFGRKPHAEAASRLYAGLVAQARRPEFYANLEVPDTFDGRFDMIALHGFLIMHRLKTGGDESMALSQALFDHMFADFDGAIREMGAGDMGVPKRVRQMVSAFLGRVTAYEEGLAGGPGDLAAALSRNVYRVEATAAAGAEALARYVEVQIKTLAVQEVEVLLKGEVAFSAPGGGSSNRIDPAGKYPQFLEGEEAHAGAAVLEQLALVLDPCPRRRHSGLIGKNN